VIVADLGDLSGILGLNFLSENGVLFDLGKGVLIFPDFEEHLQREDSLTCARVYLAEDILVIPGSSETFVNGNLGCVLFKSSECKVEPNNYDRLDQEILVPKAVVDVNDGKLIFSMLNLKPEPVTIREILKWRQCRALQMPLLTT
jgi:hypothetical protein